MRPLTRQSRHPVMVCQMVGIAIICTWQILAGVTRQSTIWHLPPHTYVLLALVNVVGALMAIAAIVTADSWTAAAFEAAASLTLSGPLMVYLWSVLTTAPNPDTNIVVALLGGLTVGLLWRVVGITVDVVGVYKEGIAPPVGDLDLMTADKVNAVSELVAAAHGGTIEREAAVLDAVLPSRHQAP